MVAGRIEKKEDAAGDATLKIWIYFRRRDQTCHGERGSCCYQHATKLKGTRFPESVGYHPPHLAAPKELQPESSVLAGEQFTMSFHELFRRATRGSDQPNGCEPYPYQSAFAEADSLFELLSVPTGVGKTATAVLGWAYRRNEHPNQAVRQATPRRLVYCLPMRTLVDQTAKCAKQWLSNLGLSDKVSVHLLMGGADDGGWDVYPERDAILIGTQDMLLSRALNRGYGMSRYRWPTHFGLLSNDCLWVLDEVQLMGSGLMTTAQLAAFGQQLWPRAKPCRFLWMSATLGEDFLDTRDRRDWGIRIGEKLELTDVDLAMPAVQMRLRAAKSIAVIKDCPKASKVLDEHATHAAGRLSLLVLNTVPAARRLFAELRDELGKPARKKKGTPPQICLVHGRFRLCDRKQRLKQVEDFASQMGKVTGAVPESSGLILVSTQVVEAGFDISSVRLWSEIAPWSSVVQRLGRLNREGLQPNSLATFWKPKEDKDRENKPDSPNARRIGPYDKSAIETANTLLGSLMQAMANGAEYRDALDKIGQTEKSQQALQVVADVVIRPDDFHELFGTDPDLAGGFTNVSQFVRDADRNVDAQVFWRDFSPKRASRLDEPQPQRDELCAVPFFELRRFLGDKGAAWEWNSESSRWERRRSTDIWPGMTLLLPISTGGYSDELGWTGIGSDKPTVHAVESPESSGLAEDPDSQTEHWYSLSDHLADVEAEVCELAQQLGLDERSKQALKVAARWHDCGKSLSRWQQAALGFATQVRTRMQDVLSKPESARFHKLIGEWLPKWSPPTVENSLWAKFPDVRDVWMDGTLTRDEQKELRRILRTPFSPKLRHEAASALAAWDAWQAGDKQLSALAVYLIASHHGKVRTVLRSTQVNDEVFGLKPSDTLRPVPGFFEQVASLHFDAKHLGAHGDWDESGTTFKMGSPSWTQVVAELLGSVEANAKPSGDAIPEHELQNLGPFALAYLEAILVAADVRASKKPGKAKAQRS